MERSRLLVTDAAELPLRQATGSLIMTLGRNTMNTLLIIFMLYFVVAPLSGSTMEVPIRIREGVIYCDHNFLYGVYRSNAALSPVEALKRKLALYDFTVDALNDAAKVIGVRTANDYQMSFLIDLDSDQAAMVIRSSGGVTAEEFNQIFSVFAQSAAYASISRKVEYWEALKLELAETDAAIQIEDDPARRILLQLLRDSLQKRIRLSMFY